MESFFGIGLPELVLILVIAGIVMGPERIGQVARWLGKTSAQMQSISRGFMRQLTQEIDGVDGDGALRDAMNEVQILRQELVSLRSEFTATTKSIEKDTRDAIEPAKNMISATSLKGLAAEVKDNSQSNPVEANEEAPANSILPPSPQVTELPSVVDIPDDPE